MYRIRIFSAALILAFLVSFLPTRRTYAATIIVNTTTDEFLFNASCSLREAIASAESNSPVGGCAAGSGADTITFSVSGTITLTIPPFLFWIGSDTAGVTIDGTGQNITINGKAHVGFGVKRSMMACRKSP